ncbi:MAG TPA: molybdenum cofactor biosynthesis protein MoaE [Chthoniobacterales bacterium]|nr:molybdenum cofactor biosynthesis protein MoaE [Chthoniobacterales bacterium]
MHRCEVKVTREPLLPLPCVFSTEHGAVVDFFGVVRENENDTTISGLEYEAFVEMAEAELRRISEETAQKFSLGAVIVHHRIGFVPAGEASLFVRVSARHRGAAFAGSQQLVELLKARVPIWKRPIPAKTHSA